MSLHPTKSKCMVIGTSYKTKRASNLHLTINGMYLKNVNNHKLLGIHIDSNLKWSCQTDFVCKKINSKISLLKKVVYYLTDDMKYMFYNSFILPQLDFCCHIWGKGNGSNVNKIYTLQKRVARIILKKPKQSSSSRLLQVLKWLTFTDRCKYHTAVLIFKTQNNMVPSYMSDLITFSNDDHYALRSASKHDLVINKLPRTNYFKDSFSYYSMKVWNEIPIEIRSVHKLPLFKQKYKLFLLNKSFH